MKAFALASLALFVSAQPPVVSSPAHCPGWNLLRDDPPPVPIDCPMCGGNAEAHQRTVIFFLEYQATLTLWSAVHSSTLP
jgi:hypothetical protein